MRSSSARTGLTLLLLSCLMLVSCGPSGAVPTNTTVPGPTPAPTTGAVTSSTPTAPPAILPSPQPTSTRVPSTAEPPATLSEGPVTIEIVGESTQHTFIKPGETADLPYWHEYVALVHYPYLLGSTDSGSFRPYPVDVSVSSAAWQAQIRNYPNGQTLNLHLIGSTPGQFTVTINAGPKVQPVSFTMQVQPPAATATPTPASTSSPAQTRAVTLADDGQAITLRVGDRFLLNLGDNLDWSVSVADPTILDRVVNVLVVKGAQGIYEAKKAGTTTLDATGDPPCRKSRPACAAPSRLFRIQVTVR